MKAPRILPLVGVAIGGVLAVKALSSVEALPQFFEGAKAMAEGTAGAAPNATGKGKPGAPQAIASRPPPPVCAPTAAELAKEAGLSPAELQTLQSLGVRRGQLDDREKGMDTQLALMAAAEAKLDAKIAALNGLKGEIRGLMGQADQQKAVELDRLVIVYQQMKPKDAAARMTLLDDEVRLPIAAKMKDRNLSAILGFMAPADAKALTEKLAARFDPKLAAMRAALANQPAAQAPQQAAAAKPGAPGKTPAPSPTAAKPTQVASADPIAPGAAAKPAAKPAAPHPKPKPKARPVQRAAAKPAPAPAAAKPTAVAANTGPKPYASLQPQGLSPAGAKPTTAAAAKPVAPLTPVGAKPAAAKAG